MRINPYTAIYATVFFIVFALFCTLFACLAGYAGHPAWAWVIGTLGFISFVISWYTDRVNS